ncbi:MAG TPA: hypothetical protein VFL90_09265 [Methylomirabilota bacterium]|nr:hypothetical protein [Methylomirabilota bacterium]
MTRPACALWLVAALLGGCATTTAGGDVGDLAGHWLGSVFETGSWLIIGNSAVDVTIAPDGTWRGTIGRMTASGTAGRRGDLLVLDGFASSPDGRWQSVYYGLKGDGSVRWGAISTPFNGVREDHALVSLRKTS